MPTAVSTTPALVVAAAWGHPIRLLIEAIVRGGCLDLARKPSVPLPVYCHKTGQHDLLGRVRPESHEWCKQGRDYEAHQARVQVSSVAGLKFD